MYMYVYPKHSELRYCTPTLLFQPSSPSPPSQHSTVDDPIEHGVAIVADTDTWTCKLMVASRDAQTKLVDTNRIQCNLSNQDTLGTEGSVLISEVS